MEKLGAIRDSENNVCGFAACAKRSLAAERPVYTYFAKN